MKNQVYSIDSNSSAYYEIFQNYVIINFLQTNKNLYSDLFLIVDNLITYCSNNLDVDFLFTYPGTANPLVVKSQIEVVKNKNFSYRLFYDKFEIYDLSNFENNILEYYCEIASHYCDEHNLNINDVCYSNIAEYCKQQNFKDTALCFPLRNNIPITTPVRYYKVNNEGLFVEEYENKPNIEDRFFPSIRLSEKFKTHNISIDSNNKIHFTVKQ
jgi:hypothetical protein